MFIKNVVWNIPLKTVSEANSSEHWTAKSKRHRQQQFFVRALFAKLDQLVSTPCTVVLTRLGPRYLDADDNLPCSFKWIKDEIADCLFPEKVKTYKDKKGRQKTLKGRSDDSPVVKWEYAQEKSSTYAIRIEILQYIIGRE